jgi:hypothetical protein
MNLSQHEAIFQKALVSVNPEAILEVARAFEGMGQSHKAKLLSERIYGPLTAISFGAAGESRSISDLKDIMAAKDVAMSNLASMFTEVLAGPNASKIQTTGLADAYKALVSRYTDARAIAQKEIDKHNYDIVPDAISDATSQYEHLLDVLNSHWRENKWAAGDWSLEDVYSRIMALGAQGKNEIPTPQPIAPSALGILNQTTHSIEDTAKNFGQGAIAAAKGAGTLAGQATTALSNQLDWQTILKIGAIALVALVLLPNILPIKAIH